MIANNDARNPLFSFEKLYELSYSRGLSSVRNRRTGLVFRRTPCNPQEKRYIDSNGTLCNFSMNKASNRGRYENMTCKTLSLIPGILLASLIFSSCASSERMNRMSGILGSYEKPRKDRISGFSVRSAQDKLSPLDDSLINLWPFFHRNNQYTSVLWPMIDSDPYGFAVRPFYNQEGNEYSILFPFCAWNPVNGDGWVANAYWNRQGFGVFPIFHSAENPKNLNYYTLFWMWNGSRGIFPIARFGDGISYAGPAWWYCGDAHSSGGFFPLVRITTRNRTLSYAGPFWVREKSFGLFPVFQYSPEEISYAGPFWKDASDQTFGLFPLFRFRNGTDHFFFPLYSISRNGKRFLSPLAAWDDNGMLSILGPVYFRSRQELRNQPGTNPLFLGGKQVTERSFQLFALLGYAGRRTVFRWPVECDLSRLHSKRMDGILEHRPYLTYQLEKLGYRGKFPETETERKQLQTELPAKTVRQDESYFGLVPLFHWERSPSELTFRLLLFLPYYRNATGNSREFSFLGPLLFRWHRKEFSHPGQRIYALEHDYAIARSGLFSLPLLGGIRTKTFYAASPARERLREQIAASRADENRIDRDKISAELRKWNPALTLPESIEDGESLRAFLADAALSCDLPVRTEWTGGWLPLFLKTGKNRWLFPPLLSGFQYSQHKQLFFSLPLLSLIKHNRKETIRHFLFPVGWMESETRKDRDKALICEADEILDSLSSVRESGFGILLGLYFQNKNTILVAVNKGEAQRLNKLRATLQDRIRRLKRLAQVETKLRLQRPRLEDAVKRQTGNTFPLNHADACREAASAAPAGKGFRNALWQLERNYRETSRLREMLSSTRNDLQKALDSLGIPRQNLDMDSENELQASLDSLYGKRIRECSVHQLGTWFARRSSAENASRWDLAWILAEGSASGDQEEMRILRYLYRFRRNGTRSEMLLPFFSLQKDGADRRISFFWRLWESRTINGRTSGHLFFLPFGEKE